MALLKILILGDKTLRSKSEPVDRITAEVRKLAGDMIETMHAAPGIGLAAIQVGVPRRIVVVDIAHKERAAQPRVFINPEIIWSSEEMSTFEEGCLSIPNIYADVDRPAKVRLKYTDLDCMNHEIDGEGLFAACIQHEIDHLNGKLLIDHISRLKRDRVIRKFNKPAKRSVK